MLRLDFVQYELDDELRKSDNHQTDNGVQNGIFGTTDVAGITTGSNVFEAAEDDHHDSYNAYHQRENINHCGDNAIDTSGRVGLAGSSSTIGPIGDGKA